MLSTVNIESFIEINPELKDKVHHYHGNKQKIFVSRLHTP